MRYNSCFGTEIMFNFFRRGASYTGPIPGLYEQMTWGVRYFSYYKENPMAWAFVSLEEDEVDHLCRVIGRQVSQPS